MNRSLLFYTFVAALGGLLFGFDTAVISGTTELITDYFELSDVMLGWAVSSALVGCVVGAIAVGKPGDIYGRRAMLVFTAFLLLLSALGTGLAVNFTMFVIARFIGGVGVGGASVMAPMYISEIAPPKSRGKLVATNQLAIVSGIVVAFFSNFLLKDIEGINWRLMFLAEAVPAIIFLVMLFFISRSPRWLVEKGRIDKAELTLAKLNKPEDAKKILGDIIASINQDVISHSSALFKKPYLRLLLIGIVVALFNQLTGINVIMYYAPKIFVTAGFDSDSALFQTVLIGVTNLTFTILGMVLIDKLGRKYLLLLGSIGMSVFLGMFAVTCFVKILGGYWLLACLLGFITFFCSSQGVVIWVILSEMFPNNVRGRMTSMCSFALWFFNAVSAFLFPVAVTRLGIGMVFAFYAIATAGSFIFFKMYLVETKGKSLEELERIVLEV